MKTRMRTNIGKVWSQAVGLIVVMICLGTLATSAPAQVLKGSRALTNEDVVRMVKTRVSESAILAKIRANPAKFDLSREKMVALHRQGVTTHVLNFMVLAAIRQRKLGEGKNADDLNPQPYPPKGQLLNPGAQRTLLGTQTNSASNPGGNSALVPAVQRPAITDGTAEAGSTNRGGFADGSKSALIPAVQRPAVAASTLNGGGKAAITDGTRPAVAQTMVMQKAPPAIGARQTMSAPGNAGTSKLLAPQTVGTAGATLSSSPSSGNGSPARLGSLAPMQQVPSMTVAAQCAADPTPRIISVTSNSGSFNGVFRPGPLYTISGCSFGSSGAVVLNPDEGNAWSFVSIYLDIVSWSDKAIVVSFPSDPAYLQWLRQDVPSWPVRLCVQAFTYTLNPLAQADGFTYSTYPQ